MKIEFIAAIQGRNCLHFDGDQSGSLKLDFSADQASSVIHLLPHTERLLKITVELSE